MTSFTLFNPLPLPFLSFLSCVPSCPPSLTLGGVSIDKSDPSTVEALVGQTVVLPCRVSPPPSSTVIVEWRRDGIPLSHNRYTFTLNHSLTHSHTQSVPHLSIKATSTSFPRHHQQPNGSLLVGPLTKADSGWFLCLVTRVGERDHRYIYLSVTGEAKPL